MSSHSTPARDPELASVDAKSYNGAPRVPSWREEDEKVSDQEQLNVDAPVTFPGLRKYLKPLQVEARGIVPTRPEERTDRKYWKILTIWLAADLNILPFSAGSLGPVVFGLGFRDSALAIFGFTLYGCLLPGYFSTFGPKLGMRQMVQARYSWGYYLTVLPAILNAITLMGFMILSCILGGQTLSSVSDGRLSWNVGIVIIAIVSLFISFCGYRVLNWYERVSWVPILIIFVIVVGMGGKHLSDFPPPAPVTARQVISFGATLAGFVIGWTTISSDFSTYMRPETPSWKIFLCSYFGIFVPTVLIELLGAAFASALVAVPAWSDAYDEFNIGGLLYAVLRPAGGFGGFLTVLLALSVVANAAPSLYSLTISMQLIIPPLYVVPRPVFSIIATAILIPLSIVGKTRFYENLINFLGILGYWVGLVGGVVLTEHLVIRRGKWENYDVTQWDRPDKLPLGLAALVASLGACSFLWAVMDQIWWVGPIAKSSGDIGLEVAFFVTAILYAPLRLLEKRFIGR